ncbi:transposon Tf2-9 polyprotein [Trichonephila clavipes]|nr:transposon Tf2-9 polyprotein [Trichonephila clavipes]
MEEKQNCIQTPVNKGTAQFCYKKQKMESYIPFTTCRKRQIQQKKKDYAKKELITRIARWALQLEEFDYEIEYRAGSRMKHVDALSRYPVMMVCNDTLTSKLKKAQEEDDNIQTLKSLLEKQESEEFFERNDILYKYLNGRELIVTPKAMQAELIKLIHENGHFSVGKTEEIVKQEFFIPNLSNVVKKRSLQNYSTTEENIQPLQIATGVPRGNGQVERIHRTLIPVLTKLSLDDSTKWYKYVDRLQRILNSTVSRSTKWTPFELLVGIKMRNKEDILIKDLLLEEMAKELLEQREFLRNDAKKNIQTLQSENRKTYNRRRKKASLYKEGDLVAIQRIQFGAGLKLRPKFLGPYKVTKVNSKDRYEVERVGQHEGSNSTTISADLMKHFYA